MAMRTMPAPSRVAPAQANGGAALTPGAPDVSLTTAAGVTTTITQNQQQQQQAMQSPQAAIDNLIDAMDRFTASTSSQQQASFRPSGAATLGPRPLGTQQQQQQQSSGNL